MAKNDQLVDGIRVDIQSVRTFTDLAEKEEVTEEDVKKLVSTQGIQYLIEQEGKETSDFDEKRVGEYVKRAAQGLLEEDRGGWAAAFRDNSAIKNRLEHIAEQWDSLVVHPLRVAATYVSEDRREGTGFFVPAGSSQSYADDKGFAFNMGRAMKDDSEWVCRLAQACFHFLEIRTMGKDLSLKVCETPSEFIEAFLDLAHRQGMAIFVGLKATETVDQFYQHVDLEKNSKLFARAFQLALDGKAPSKRDELSKIFYEYPSPSALMGGVVAKAIEEWGTMIGYTAQREALSDTMSQLGFYLFFEVYRGCDTIPSLLPDVVWKAFRKVKDKRGLRSVRDGDFLPSL